MGTIILIVVALGIGVLIGKHLNDRKASLPKKPAKKTSRKKAK